MLELKGKILNSLKMMRNLAGKKHILGTGQGDQKKWIKSHNSYKLHSKVRDGMKSSTSKILTRHTICYNHFR